MKKSNSCIIYSILLLSILVQIFVNWGYEYKISSESYVFSEKYFWVLWDISSLIVILSAFLIINKNYTFKYYFSYKIIFLIGIFPFILGNLFWAQTAPPRLLLERKSVQPTQKISRNLKINPKSIKKNMFFNKTDVILTWDLSRKLRHVKMYIKTGLKTKN